MRSRIASRPLQITGLICAGAIVLCWSILLAIYGAEQIASWIGVERGYWLMFIVATLGGASTVTSATFYTTLVTLGAGGSNPLWLGITAGLGLVIGDSLFYYLGWGGGGLFGKYIDSVIGKLANWLERQQKWKVMLFVFAYVGLTPLPNDILTVSMGIAGYRYKYLFPGLLLGNIFISVVVAYAASIGFVA